MAAQFGVDGGRGVFISVSLNTRRLEFRTKAILYNTFLYKSEKIGYILTETVGSYTSSDRDSLHVAMQRRKAL